MKRPPAGKRLPALVLLYLTCLLMVQAYGFSQLRTDLFGNRELQGMISSDEIDEASGLASSIINPGILWTHNDSGDRNRIFAIDNTGQLVGEYTLDGCDARDWEDIAVGPGPEEHTSYLYVGNIGDNRAHYNIKYIYRVKEPVIQRLPGDHVFKETLSGADILEFSLPDGNRDTETLMIDPLNRDLYIISKRENPVHVYRLPYPQNPDTLLIPELVATIPCTLAVAGDINPTGNEVLIKTYDLVFHWTRSPEQSIANLLSTPPDTLPYFPPEPQGEGIAWELYGTGYYTLSEEPDDIPAYLYFYPRIGRDDD